MTNIQQFSPNNYTVTRDMASLEETVSQVTPSTANGPPGGSLKSSYRDALCEHIILIAGRKYILSKIEFRLI